MANGGKRKWYELLALRVALGLAGLILCSIGVGILINLEAASGVEPDGELMRLFQPLPMGQMAWWAVLSVLLGFAVLTNVTHWMRTRRFAYVQAGFFLPATVGVVGLCVSSIVSLSAGVGTLRATLLQGLVAAVCLLCLLRAVGIAWRWADRPAEQSTSRSQPT